jgi:nucleoside phosphorylase/predicted dehydrogenase
MSQQHVSPADFIIITALEEERDAVLNRLPGYNKLPPQDNEIRVYYSSDLPVSLSDGSKGAYRLIIMPLFGMGRVEAANAANHAISRWQPRYVILVGIAGGIATRGVMLGDVLIPNQIVDYELQKQTPKGDELRFQVYPTDPKFIGIASNFNSYHWHTVVTAKRPRKGLPKRHIGPIASGDKVIAFGEVLEKYRDKWPMLIGVEMEAAGVAAAAFQAVPAPGFFMVRGVSDLADTRKDSAYVKRWRAYACDVAASYLIALLESGPISLNLPTPQRNIIARLEFVLDGPLSHFNEEEFKAALREVVGPIESVRIVEIKEGSIKISIEGGSEDLTQIVETFQSSEELQRRFAQKTGAEFISYIEGKHKTRLQPERIQDKRLPEGVFNLPRQERLIAKDERAIICINTNPPYFGNAKYGVEDYSFEHAIAPFLHGDWDEFDRFFRLSRKRIARAAGGGALESPLVYSSTEHSGEPKLPDITVLPNLTTKESRGARSPLTVFGCSMGHYYLLPASDPRIQSVYEFQSYGMMVLDCEQGHLELWVAQEGDKIAVSGGCHMALYNLGDDDNPLIILDFQNQQRNMIQRNLASKYGPSLLTYYDDFEIVFVLNHLHINNPDHSAGVRLASPPREKRDQQVRLERRQELELGRHLYEQLTQNPEVIGRFSRLGVYIKQASPEVALQSSKGPPLYFSMPLVEATKKGTDVYRYFFPNAEKARLGASRRKAILMAKPERVREEQGIALAPLNRPLTIVVEGVGDWVEQVYRKLFKKKVSEGKRVSVFYIDDTRWKARPKWADASDPNFDLSSWEVYLDKADPDDFNKYRILLPDVVFVVTPSFTHSSIARWWLGKAPVVFVEQPFDTQVKSLDDLLVNLKQQHDTAILGLDHYLFYAHPIRELKPIIESHLDGALIRVNFYMTDISPINLARIRSMQYGLTLDRLPHLLALLTHFGDVGSIDEIQVLEAGQYRPMVAAGHGRSESVANISPLFYGETYSRLRFTFQDYSGNGHRVPVQAIVGAGLSRDVKYLEVEGRNGNAIRIDFSKSDANRSPDYPWDSLFFILAEGAPLPPGRQARQVSDPYNLHRTLLVLNGPDFYHRLDRSRYDGLIEDLLNGTSNVMASTLSPLQGQQIALAIERTSRAVKESAPWPEYELGTLDPLQLKETH